jgi:dienelactone hydrolase
MRLTALTHGNNGNGVLDTSMRNVVVFALVCSSAFAAEGRPLFWGHLRAGRFGVGFRTVHEKSGELHVWYPAVADSRAPLSMADYLRLSRDLKGSVEQFENDDAALGKTLTVAITGQADTLDRAKLEEILRVPLAAHRNARPVARKFPLVLWTHRYATTACQSVLNEYLASYGFVVVYAPAKVPPVLPSEFKSAGEKARELHQQVIRLRAVLLDARTMSNVRPDAVAVMAWSYAGESAYALQQAEPTVKAVVSLTSNVLENWVYRPEPPGAQPERMRVPYILLDGDNEQPPKAMTYAAARTFFIRLNAMAHGSFNALEGMVPSVMGISIVPPWSKAGPEQQLGYEVSAQYVLRTLEHYLYAVPTLDTPFRLWAPDGDVKEGFVQVTEGGTAPPVPEQPEFRTVHFTSTGNLQVTADLYAIGNREAPTIVLAHQSGSSRGEYRQVAPRLLRLGFNALVIDTRWGDRDSWNGVINETAKRFGTPAIVESHDPRRMRPVQEAAADDVRAALHWLATNGYPGAKLLWGSSMSANLVLKVAAERQNQLAGVLAFSPGEYHRDTPREVRSAIADLNIPVLIVCGVDEEGVSKPIFEALPAGNKFYYAAVRGRHGSSILLDDQANWTSIEPFLRRLAISGRTLRQRSNAARSIDR